MKRHLFSLNEKDIPLTRISKFGNYFIRHGKKERTGKMMREILGKLKKKSEYKLNPSSYLLSIFSKFYLSMSFRTQKKRSNPKLIPCWRPKNTSFFQSVSPLLKAIKKNRARKYKLQDRIYVEILGLEGPDSDVVRQAEEIRRELYKNKGNLRNYR